MAALVKGETPMMVSSTRQAVAGIFFTFAIAVCAHAQTVPAKDPTATITGKVTIKNKGAPGIAVALRNNQDSHRQTSNYRAVTNDDGEYRITDVPVGSYQIRTVAPAFVASGDRYGRQLIVNKGETIEHIDFTLVPGGVITGKVTDTDGRPVIEIEVFVVPLEARERAWQGESVLTDDRGVYRIFGLAAGTYRIGAGRDDGGAFYGRSHVSYKRTYYPAAAELAQATPIDVAEGSEATNIDVTLNRPLTTYTVSGRIVNATTGQPVPNLGYGVTYYHDANSTSSWDNGAVSNERGEFKFEGLLPGKYSVSVSASKDSNWRADPIRFEVRDQDVGDLVIKASAASSVSGVLVIEGTTDKELLTQLARTGLSVSVSRSSDDVQSSGSSTIAADGRFWITGLQSGLVTFSVSNSEHFRLVRVEQNGVMQPRGVELKDGQQLEGLKVVVQYANASLRGAIEIENGPLPENGQLTVALRTPGSLDRGFGGAARVDARGQFLIEGLVPGNYVLNVGAYIPGSPPTFVKKSQDVVVTAGAANNVTVTLDLKSNTTRPE